MDNPTSHNGCFLVLKWSWGKPSERDPNLITNSSYVFTNFEFRIYEFFNDFLLLFIFYWQTEEATCFRPIRNLLLFQLLKRDKIGEGNWRKPLLNSLLIFMKILFVEIESSDLYDCNEHIALNVIKLAFKYNFVRMAKKEKR